MTLTRPERRLAAGMRIFAAAFIVAVLIYGLAPWIGPVTSFARRLPFVAFSVVKVATLALVCIYAGSSPRERRGLAWVAVGGHLVSLAAMLLVLAFTDTSRVVTMGPMAQPIGQVLWGAIALDGVICGILVWLALGARAAALEATQGAAVPVKEPLLPAERQLAAFLMLMLVVFVGGAVFFELGALIPSWQPAFVELPFVTNSVVRDGTLALVTIFVLRDVRGRVGVVSILVVSLMVSAAVQGLYWFGAGAEAPMVLFGRTIAIRDALAVGAGVDLAGSLLVLAMQRRAWRARFAPQFLSLRGYRTLGALADVLVVGPDEQVSPEIIARNVDRYFSNIASRRRIVHRMALFIVHFHPVFYFRAPLPQLDPVLCAEHLKRHFYQEVTLRLIPIGVRQWVSGLIKVAKQLTYVGYYNDRRADASVGYTRFKDRPHPVPVPPPKPVALKVATPESIETDALHYEADVCVIGSGAAGAILAYRFAEAGKSVIVLERGKFVQPTAFTDDEVDMIGKLYDDGIFQQTRDLRFTILQGSCVGGTTVVNNAVSFRTPEPVVRESWNDRFRWDAGVDYAELMRSAERVEKWLPIIPQNYNPKILNPSGELFIEGARRLGHPLQADVVAANIVDCKGCGYCNIGCAFGHKMSMLETVLPWGQKKFGDRFRIIAECAVTRLIPGRSGPDGKRVGTVRAQLSDGRALTVRADTVVVAAGAIASSYILQQSGIGKGLPVGEGMSFNMGSAMTAEFDQRLDAYAGLQISHYGLPRSGRGWVFETWWNPPVAQALNMPGWFEQHYDNMRRFPYMMGVGVLVGTESTGQVRSALLGGADVVYEPSENDRRKLADGLIELGQILFAAGARRVMVNGWDYYEFTSPATLGDLIPLALDAEELALGTGHPQGGNAISRSPARGVVGPDFRVHGWENLFVCDASVIPSSLTVNPQLTVMSLADYAAPRMMT